MVEISKVDFEGGEGGRKMVDWFIERERQSEALKRGREVVYIGIE